LGSLKKYGKDALAVEEWVPWGGIVRPSVMREKDGSLLAVIRYQPFSMTVKEGEEPVFTPYPFRRGWVLWNEHQHGADGTDADFLAVCWNPFTMKGRAAVPNVLTKDRVLAKDTVDYFEQEMARFLAYLQKLTEAELLTYQAIMDFLSFSVSLGDDHPLMPDIPLYMDALLTQDLTFRFTANDIFINDKRLLMLSLPSKPDPSPFYHAFSNLPYRHVRRLLCFNEKEARTDFVRYTKKWFPSRRVIRRMGMEHLLGAYNGYLTEHFCFLLAPAMDKEFRPFLEDFLRKQGCPYLLESYRLKEAFWGSLPGLFLADARPPVVGFPYLAEFLTATVTYQKKPKVNVKRRQLSDAEQKLEANLAAEPSDRKGEEHVPAGPIQPAS